ncbi:hypothetical protein SYNPS1DRAFT_28023 [Syncephalis pseudoplumigaleata]|uniref:T-cell immunomodulatory protein TIP C2 domain-containing protein n=1 Tax=Syncephalis pseudoplumigaleata TaxID=1712513 RepID=A0A4P9Z1C2_9FUNG|nr:hypothetical protein SYNPS1DRAFT_28023 [Syncephalis pseudoplumigaleata]|eukprot:RKP26277.1 hypothetical protein SYNPS1DRAFT_28023 [Syncephalis pseudoplumigaleata]
MYAMRYLLYVWLVCGLYQWLPWTYAAEQYASDALYKDDLGLDHVLGHPVAFGDFNSDKFTDIFVLSGDQRTLTVYLWQPDAKQFKASTAMISIPSSEDGAFVIENVIPGDFNYDGALDVLLMGRKGPIERDDPKGDLLMRVYLGNGRDRLDPGYITVPASTAAQPIPFDFAGDMRIHLLGYPANKPDTLSVWKNRPIEAGQNATELFDIVTMPQSERFCKFSHPHSGAFVDLNGDCLSDLFLTCESNATGMATYQIWTNNKSDGFALAREGNLPKGAGAVSFADIGGEILMHAAGLDGDGSVDMIVPSCSAKQDDCYLHILYNQQERLCGFDDGSASCRTLDELCRADPQFAFVDPTKDAGSAVSIDEWIDGIYARHSYDAMPGLYEDIGAAYVQWHAAATAGHRIPWQPAGARANSGGDAVAVSTIGDIDQDGYPDLLLLVHKGDGHTGARIVTSVPCTEEICTKEQTSMSRRAFVVLNRHTEALDQLANVRSAAFFDFNEDGTHDMIVLSKPDTLEHGTDIAARQITTLQNNYFNDAFFLKTLVLNGACASHCPVDDGYPIERPYGVNYHGAAFKYTVIDRKGRKHAKEGGQSMIYARSDGACLLMCMRMLVVQMVQSTYLAMQMPYSLFGLGRTNNYVEELFVGVTRHQASQTKHYRVWMGVIPNSQLIVVPHQAEKDHSPMGWTRELFVNPSAYVPHVLSALVGIGIILALIVRFLARQERREDQREKLSTSHVFNFDAL